MDPLLHLPKGASEFSRGNCCGSSNYRFTAQIDIKFIGASKNDFLTEKLLLLRLPEQSTQKLVFFAPWEAITKEYEIIK